MKYKILKEVEILGEIRGVGSEIEIDKDTGEFFVASGEIEEIKENEPVDSTTEPIGEQTMDPEINPVPQAEPASVSIEPTEEPPAEPSAKDSEPWVGRHSMETPEE